MPSKQNKTNINCVPSNYDELPQEIKDRYVTTDDLKNEKFIILTDFQGLEQLSVKTSNENIVNTIKHITKDSKDNKIKVFSSVLSSLLEYRWKVKELYEKGGVSWQNVLDDLVLYYCYRAILFNKAIPIISINDFDEKIKSSGVNFFKSY